MNLEAFLFLFLLKLLIMVTDAAPKNKRQVAPRPLYNRQNQECITNCARKFEQNTKKEIGLKVKEAFQLGLINRQLFEGDKFEKSCSFYTDTKECFKECSTQPEKHLSSGTLKLLDHICLNRHSEFNANMPCYQKAAKHAGMFACDHKCGANSYSRMVERLADKRDILGTLALLNSVCEHISCTLNCEIPIYNRVCNSTRPGNLLREFVSVGVSEGRDIMERAKVGHLYPNNCKNLTESILWVSDQPRQTQGSMEPVFSYLSVCLSLILVLLLMA